MKTGPYNDFRGMALARATVKRHKTEIVLEAIFRAALYETRGKLARARNKGQGSLARYPENGFAWLGPNYTMPS